MTGLLQVVKADPLEKEGARPIAHEWVVNPHTKPYLVLGFRDLIWVERSVPGVQGQTGIVRSAVRESTGEFDPLYTQIVEKVARRSLEYSWGQLHVDTLDGVVAAAEYLLYFLKGPSEYPPNPAHLNIEILTAEDSPLEKSVLEVGGRKYPVHITPWLPSRVSVVVPTDRGFLGDLHLFGPSMYTAVVHNPARGIGISAPQGMYHDVASDLPIEDDTGK